MATRPYDPGKIIILFRGKQILGFADGTFVKEMRAEESFKNKAGANGDVVRTRNRNKMGSVTVTLQSTSLSNDDLSSALALDELSGTGAGALLVKDLLGNSLIQAEKAWVQKPADAPFGDDAENREWTLDCGEINIFNGGNPSL